MAVNPVTYRELDKLLRELGFSLQLVPDPKNRSWRYYNHPESETEIILMDNKPTENVRETDILSARRHLIEKGLVSEEELDRLLISRRERSAQPG